MGPDEQLTGSLASRGFLRVEHGVQNHTLQVAQPDKSWFAGLRSTPYMDPYSCSVVIVSLYTCLLQAKKAYVARPSLLTIEAKQ